MFYRQDFGGLEYFYVYGVEVDVDDVLDRYLLACWSAVRSPRADTATTKSLFPRSARSLRSMAVVDTVNGGRDWLLAVVNVTGRQAELITEIAAGQPAGHTAY